VHQGNPISLGAQAASTTIAQQKPSARRTYQDNPVSFGFHVAPFGSPGGLLGFTADVALLPELSLTGAVGLGTVGSVAQYAIAARPRIPITSFLALDLTAGVSRGDYDRMVTLDSTELYRNCTWANVDFGPEMRFSSHVMLHPFVGISRLAASDPPRWIGNDYDRSIASERWPWLAYLGLVVAYYGGWS
jgi:hypothetical protein